MQAHCFNVPHGYRVQLVSRALAALVVLCVTCAALPSAAQTVERLRATGRINLGYIADARPLSFRSQAGAPEGFGVALCQQVVERLQTLLAVPQLAAQWVPVTVDSRTRDVQQGRVDLQCTPTSVTLARRQDVGFSLPVFPGGTRAAVRTDTAIRLLEALAENPTLRPVWRGSPAAKVLEGTTFAVVAGTTAATWLEGRRTALRVNAEVVPVPDYATGVSQLLARDVDVLFGDRAVILGALDDAASEDVVILDRRFTHESGAFMLARGDDAFRLAVDTALSEIYTTGAFGDLYTTWFGAFDDSARTFYQWTALPQQ